MNRSLLVTAATTVTILCMLAVVACAHPHPSQRQQGATAADRTAYLVVENTLTDPFRMYVSDGAQRLPMGSVNPLSTSRLRIPPSVIFPAVSLEFIAVPASGNGASISERLTVGPGDEIHLRLAR